MPVVGGHEGAGIVVKVGPGVTRFAEGDHVVAGVHPRVRVPPVLARRAEHLRRGAGLLTGLSISDKTHRVTLNGQGFTQMRLSAPLPYITVNQASLVKNRGRHPLKEAALPVAVSRRDGDRPPRSAGPVPATPS